MPQWRCRAGKTQAHETHADAHAKRGALRAAGHPAQWATLPPEALQIGYPGRGGAERSAILKPTSFRDVPAAFCRAITACPMNSPLPNATKYPNPASKRSDVLIQFVTVKRIARLGPQGVARTQTRPASNRRTFPPPEVCSKFLRWTPQGRQFQIHPRPYSRCARQKLRARAKFNRTNLILLQTRRGLRAGLENVVNKTGHLGSLHSDGRQSHRIGSSIRLRYGPGKLARWRSSQATSASMRAALTTSKNSSASMR